VASPLTPRDQALLRLGAAVEHLERAADIRAGGRRANGDATTDEATEEALAELDRTIARLKTLVGEHEGRG
jgi:hypothetical protein